MVMQEHNYKASAQFLVKQLLLCIIYVASLAWVLWWLISFEAPRHYNATKYLDRLEKHIRSRFFRTDAFYGSVLLYQALPFIVIGILSFAVVELRRRLELENAGKKRNTKAACVRMMTYPLIVRSPLGVLTVAEVLFIVCILFLVSYTFARTTYLRFEELQLRFRLQPNLFKASVKWTKVAAASYCMGRAAMIPFCLLWIPVSRGSPFLRLIRMPFEHAVKYHIWLAMLTLSMLTLHGISYAIYFAGTHRAFKIIEWDAQGESCSIVAGVVALIVGLAMWTTSLSFFRRRWYELFFGIHHLYIIFFIFFLYHVMWTVHFIVIPCLFFVVDRFLRMVQSRHSVDVVSARLMESGALHLKIAAARDINAQGIGHHALSSWYLRIPSLSSIMKFQWHFFSTTSTPMHGNDELSFMIKPLGKWTANLRDQLFKSSHDHISGSPLCPFSFKAGLEGPYGDESNFFLRYKVLILIGGGIGITPLLAILREILHRKKLGENELPNSIHIYHCVRKSEELCILQSLDPNSIIPDYQKQGMKIDVHTYITSDMNDLRFSSKHSNEKTKLSFTDTEVVFSPQFPSGKTPCGVSSISSKGAPMWVACTMGASIIGYYVLWGLSNVFIVKDAESKLHNYDRAHLVLTSMILGTTIFGGMIVLAWHRHLKQLQHQLKCSTPLPSSTSIDSGKTESHSFFGTSSNMSTPHSKNSLLPIFNSAAVQGHHKSENPSLSGSLLVANKPEELIVVFDEVKIGSEASCAEQGGRWNEKLQIGHRPDWDEIFNNLNKVYQGQNLAVLVSGPQGMRTDVAEQCQKHTSLIQRKGSTNVFHYHSISFDL